MSVTDRSWWRRLLVLPPIAVGIAMLALQIGGRETPEQVPAREIARPVRVISVTPGDFVPKAVGFGFAAPGTVWNATAQVSGKVIERHPDLEPGKLFDAQTVILQIDPVDYELAVAQIEASIKSVEAELAELRVREDNTRVSLDIERRMVALAEDDRSRKQKLLHRGDVSDSSVDEAEKTVLNARQKVQDLENQINLLPTQRQVLEATLALNRAKLSDARLDLERTVLALPFDLRIAAVHVEENQFVNVGTVLVEADSIDVAEVTAQVPMEQMATLVRRDTDLRHYSAAEIDQFVDRFGIKAHVHLRTGQIAASWEARMDRISPAIDPKTRTVGVVVAVEEPYRQAVPGRKPPLMKNMYVQVDLIGQPWSERIVIPRVALHRTPGGHRVYVADGNDRLLILPVTAGPAQGDLVVIEQGLEAGERVVVSDLIPAIDGMLLTPTMDDDLARRLREEAARPAVDEQQP